MKNRRLQCLLLLLFFVSAHSRRASADAVHSYTKIVEVAVDAAGVPATVSQKRWYLENDHVRVAVIDDPGGAMVEYLDKATGTDHVAGQVYKKEVDGKVEKKVGWGWENVIYDNATDPIEKQMHYQPFRVEFLDLENGAKSIKVTGQTAEQRIERQHILKRDSAELIVQNKLTNISEKPRRLWLRWHPYLFASSDTEGKAGCVLSPGKDDEVRKIRIGWGWDHWFRTHDGYWLAADANTGEGLFLTFEKEKVPVHFTWTQYKTKPPGRGALTMEPFAEPIVAEPGQFVESSFSYYPFTSDTPAEAIPLGVLTDADERTRARRFLQRVKPVEHLELLNSYTLAKSIQFAWNHRRRDLMSVREWGFADCAIVGFPSQDLPLRVRMLGAVFDDALAIKNFPVNWCHLAFNITALDQDGNAIYRNQERFRIYPGVKGQNRVDREIAVPMAGTPDGTYTLRVEAIDPLSRKVFHTQEAEVEVFDTRVQLAREKLETQLTHGFTERPFVTALREQAGDVTDKGAIIPIGIEDGSARVRLGYPVRLGVPFPQGAFPREVPTRLLSSAGQPVSAQFQPMNVWPDGSLKWLAVDFPADCPADGFTFYHLEAGPDVPVSESPRDIATVTDKAIELNTGPLMVRVPLDSLSIPGDVFLDADGSGSFEPSERVMSGFQAGDAWWEDATGRRYFMTLDGPSSHGVTPGVTLERDGPQSAVVRMTGWYADDRGQRVALGEVRVEVFRGKTFFKLWHQVTFTGSPWHDRLASYGLKLRLQPAQYKAVAFDVDGTDLPAGVEGVLYQRAHNRLDLRTAAETVHGEQSQGAVRLVGDTGSVMFYHRDFWQMFPKKLEADAKKGEITIHYWPQEAGIQDFAPYEEYWIPSSSSPEACGTGLSRTDEMVIDFSGAVSPRQARAVYGEPVIACTPPSWIQETAVLGNLAPSDPGQYPAVERYIGELTDFYQRNREFFKWYGHWDYGTIHNVFQIPLYRWLVVGRYANIGNEEDIVQTPWLLYFRSGDRKYFKFARIWTRHLMEVQSIRWHDTYPEWIGMSRRHHYTTWLGGGDWGHTMLCPWLEYYHAAGYEPAWEMAKRTAKTMQNTYEGATWRYLSNPLIGNIRMYLETGEGQYKQQADRMWNDLCADGRGRWWEGSHGSRMACWYAPLNSECMEDWKEWTNDGRPVGEKRTKEFQYLDTFGVLGDITGEDKYAFESMLAFDRNARAGKQSGQLSGVHPIYRGMTFQWAQQAIGLERQVVYAAEQIAKARALFPAAFYNGPSCEIVVRDADDAGFTLWLASQSPKSLKMTGPGSGAVPFETVSLFTSGKGLHLLRLTVKPDGKKGLYRLPVPRLPYLGCSLKTVAIVAKNRLHFPGGEPLYVRSSDLGDKRVRVLMDGTPGSSLELFTMDGERLFSRTYVRPKNDAVAREHIIHLSTCGNVLKLGDKVGVILPEAASVPLFTNPDGIFNILSKE